MGTCGGRRWLLTSSSRETVGRGQDGRQSQPLKMGTSGSVAEKGRRDIVGRWGIGSQRIVLFVFQRMRETSEGFSLKKREESRREKVEYKGNPRKNRRTAGEMYWEGRAAGPNGQGSTPVSLKLTGK